MRKFTQRLLFSILLTCQFAPFVLGQDNYRLFRPDVMYLYENPLEANAYTSPVLGIQLGDQACEMTYTSVQISPLSEIFGECVEVVSAFIGSQVCHQTNETELTIKLEGVPHVLTLRQNAEPGQTWLAMSEPEPIYGRVEEVIEEQFFGLTDSVKYIALYRENTSGEFIPLYEEVPFRISKQYGLLSAVFLHWLGWDLGHIELLGMSNPQLGLQNPDRERIFQLEVGDVLHIKDVSSIIVQDAFQDNHREEQLTVTGVDWNEDYTILNYTFTADRKYYSEGSTASTDTIYLENQVYTQEIDWEYYEYLDGIPGEIYPSPYPPGSFNVLALFPDVFCEQASKRLMYPLSESIDSCALVGSDSNLGFAYYNQLAGPYYNSINFNGLDVRELRYANLSNGFSCGDPFDVAVNTTSPTLSAFRMYPNPATDYVELSWEQSIGEKLTVGVYDSNGRCIIPDAIISNGGRVDVSGLPAGIYMLKCSVEDGIYWLERLLVN